MDSTSELILKIRKQRAEWVLRHAAMARLEAVLIGKTVEAVEKSRRLLASTAALADPRPPSLDDLADRFASQAVASVLDPTPDGLKDLEELASPRSQRSG